MSAPARHPVEQFLAVLRPQSFPVVYCDFIADRIRRGLTTDDAKVLIAEVGRVEWDLHPEGGYLLSCDKSLTVTDKNGKTYRITVSEVR